MPCKQPFNHNILTKFALFFVLKLFFLAKYRYPIHFPHQQTEVLVQKYFKSLNQKFVHLSVDAGAKIRRYLIVIVHSSTMKPAILDLRDESHLVSGYSKDENNNDDYNDEYDDERDDERGINLRHTIENLGLAFDQIASWLYDKYNVCVGSIVTDNCSAFTGAVESSTFGVVNARCMCHGINLLIKLLSSKYSPFREAFELANKFYKVVYLKSIADAHTLREFDAVRARSGDIMLPARDIKKIETTYKKLKNYVAGIRIAEADDANQIHSLLALATFGFYEENYGLVFSKRADEKVGRLMDFKIQDRILSPALIITAFFSCAWKRTTLELASAEKIHVLQNQITRWLTRTNWCSRIVAFLHRNNPSEGFTLKKLENEFERFNNIPLQDIEAINGNSLTEEKFNNVLQLMKDNELTLLPRVISVIKDSPASEASAERGFSATDRNVPPPRSLLASETVAMGLRYSSFYAALESNKNKNNTNHNNNNNNNLVFPSYQSSLTLSHRKISEEVLNENGQENTLEETEGQKVARAVVAVIDLAVEKAVAVEKNRQAKIERKKSQCQNGMSCSGFRLDLTGCFLIRYNDQCSKTKCNCCWGDP